MSEYNIGMLDEFPEEEGVKVDVDGIDVAVFNIDGELFGIQNRCVHKNLPLHLVGRDRYYSRELLDEECAECPSAMSGDQRIRGRINRDRKSINCPWHSLEWSLETGRNEVKDVRVATYDVTVREDDTVWLKI